MHNIEPYYTWLKYYDSSFDERSPFYGKEYNYDLLQDNIYGYYIHPGWDSFESETLYLKVLFANYEKNFVIIEFIGEWNDAINNDIMLLKRNFIEVLMAEGINKFILIGENILNFHGSDDSYYEEWFEEVEDEQGWIAAVSFPEFVQDEMKRYRIDQYLNMGGTLQIEHWRTLHPNRLFELVSALITRRLGP
ncbi:hypothetical protein BH09BAC3_BH09BAC3_28050 [soil metagenome]